MNIPAGYSIEGIFKLHDGKNQIFVTLPYGLTESQQQLILDAAVKKLHEEP